MCLVHHVTVEYYFELVSVPQFLHLSKEENKALPSGGKESDEEACGGLS